MIYVEIIKWKTNRWVTIYWKKLTIAHLDYRKINIFYISRIAEFNRGDDFFSIIFITRILIW